MTQYVTPVPKENQNVSHIPGDDGWPIVGHTLAALKDSRALMHKMHRKYGSIYRTHTFFQHYVSLLGPDANQFILQDREQNFSSYLGWGSLLEQLFTRGLMLRDFEDHRFHRRIMQSAFKKPAMTAYMDLMNPTIHDTLNHWPVNQRFHFYPTIKKATLDLAAKVFLDEPLGEQADRINQAFVDTVNATVALVRVPIPGLAFGKGITGRQYLMDYFRALIPKKREQANSDMLSQLCQAKTEDNEQFSDQDIIDHMIFLMMAAHDTTTSAMTTMAYALAKHNQWQQAVYEEINSLNKSAIEYEDLERLPLLDAIFKEALRLYAPVPSIPRRVLKDCTFNGVSLYANTLISISPGYTHQMPEYWRDPHQFDPERFLSPRQEHKQHPFLWVPFGGGAHMCIGLHFAYMQVKAFMFQLLKRYQLHIDSDYQYRVKIMPIPKPYDNLPLWLTLRQ